MSMSTPVSICIPSYNGEKYLRECLNSVLSQTFADFELLIVDDCSKDKTLSIAQSYAVQDRRIRVVCNERNLGLVGNWNRCVELARGEWIKFVFQDDMIAPDCLARMLVAGGGGASLVSCGRNFLFEADTSQEVREWYEKNERAIGETWGSEESISSERFCEEILARPFSNLIGEPTAVLLRREVFRSFGDFNSHLVMSCDLEYWARVAVHRGFRRIAEPLAAFRVHGGATSAMNRANRNFRMNVLDDLVILHEFVFHPMYEPLRVAASHLPALDLASMFRKKAQWAWSVAERTARNRTLPDPALMAQWQEVAQGYPEIAKAAGQRGVWQWVRAGWRRCHNAATR